MKFTLLRKSRYWIDIVDIVHVAYDIFKVWL